MNRRVLPLIVLGASLAGVVGVASYVRAQGQQPAQQTGAPAQGQPGQRQSANNLGFPDLVGGLKASPGCLGVETARTSSGKNVIFAWFKDKQAALDWYTNPMHVGVMRQFFQADPASEPMKGVPDDIPILTIASITMSDKPMVEGTDLPISQIAIEMYTPVTGGIYFGGRFAPDGVKVDHLKNVGGE